MALWGNKDLANNAPKYLSDVDKGRIYFVDTTEAANTNNRSKGFQTPGWNLYNTYTDSDGNTRHRVECLVAMAVSAATAGDVGAITLTISEIENGKTYTIKATPSLAVTDIIVGEPYVILTNAVIDANSITNGTEYEIWLSGNTNFTALGAANNDVGTTFTANTANTAELRGSGDVIATAETNFVDIGAANNDVGVGFTANAVGTGTVATVLYDLTSIGAANNDVGTTFTANSSSANSSLKVITRVDDDILEDG